MKWKGERESEHVEDRRGQGGGLRFPFPRRGGGGLQFPGGTPGGKGGGIGLVGLLVIVVIMLLLGVDPRILLEGGGPGGQAPREAPRDTVGFPAPRQPGGVRTTDEAKSFVGVVLAKTEDVWTAQFAAQGLSYKKPSLVLFEGYTQSRCGTGVAQMGPFYCPLDQNVYIDLSFFQDLATRFRAPGDFAQAYVVAHEVGHHVQTLMGVSEQVIKAKARLPEIEANALQVRMELQADCYAGLWAHHAERIKSTLEAGDVEEALGAATAIGDDRIQKQTQGRATPDSFTHGSSEQRVRWFKRGLETGDMGACDTFKTGNL